MGEHDKQRWDEKIKPTSFEIGDLVLLTHEGKFGLEPRFKGPYVVTRVFADYGTYQLETVAGEPLQSLVHVDRLKRFVGDKPVVPHYDPTSARREVREADRNRPQIPMAGPLSTKPSSAYLPSATTTFSLDSLGPDFIDPVVTDSPVTTTEDTHMPSSSGMWPVVAQVDPQPPVVSPVEVPPTAISEDDISSENLSLHGSSIMDEENEDLVTFRHILDGYDYMSSADDDIIADTDIEDVGPAVPITEPTVAATSSTDAEIEDITSP
ncbi:hypothetical protein ABG067_008159, partial [Albugo candida]